MKRIKLNEIIECSSQQSILTGQAGFGIRTFTKGMDAEWVRNICEQVNSAYEVGIADQVTAEQIAQDANVVKKYPRTLKYTVVKDDKGEEKYVIACSTYVGIDYGFFCGIDSARRVGTNYIADILVLDEQPAPSLFYTLIEKHFFLPVDNACNANNPELKELLTGEPSYLAPRSVEIEEASCDINEQTALLAIALLQTKINQDLQKDKGLQSIIIQAQEAKVSSILQDLGKLPAEFVVDKYFQTNYLQGYGMPNGYRMLFLNEHNQEQVYIENYVYLNLDDKSTQNLDTANFFFQKIKEAAIANQYEWFITLISHLEQTKAQPDTDYQFLYHLFIVTETEKDIDIDILTEDFFKKVKAAHLPLARQEKFFKRVNQALQQASNQKNAATLSKVTQAFHYLYDNWREEEIGILASLLKTHAVEPEIISPVINSYAQFCFEHPAQAQMDCASIFLHAHALDEEKEAYLDIICRLRTNSKNVNGTYWELIIAKRLGLDIQGVRASILEKLLTYMLSQGHKPDLQHLDEYINDPYSHDTEDMRKQESFLLLDTLWSVYHAERKILEACTPAIINSAGWTTNERKEYLAQGKNKDAKAFITKYYSLGSILARKFFKKK